MFDLFEINKIIGAVLFSVLVILGVGVVSDSIFHVEAPEEPGYAVAMPEKAEPAPAAHDKKAEPEMKAAAETSEPAQAAGQAAGQAAEQGAEQAAQPEGEAKPDQMAQGEAKAEGGAAPAAAGDSAGASALGQLLAAGNADAGEKVAKKCAACHTFDEGGKNRVGPNLHGIVGRAVASGAEFSYSSALKELGGAWDYERLDAWLTNPKELVAKTSMSFAGVKKAEDRADLIAYLRSISPDAPPLP